MIFGSVCSGIEAASVAWHPLGWRAAFYSEIEKFPRAVLAHHFPEVPCHGDFTTIKGDEYEPIDVLVGGTPCQDFSVAGLRAGFGGSRGHLTLEFVRLAARLRPRWIVWENVCGVLSIDGGRAFGAFLGGLAELGYGFAYRIFDAQYAGLAQRRERVFVVGYLGDWRRAAAVLFERESLRWDTAPRREAGSCVAASSASGVGTCGADDNQPQGGHLIARCDTPGEAGRQNFETTTLIAHTPRGEGFDTSEDGTGRGIPLTAAFFCKDHGADAGELAPTLRAMGHSGSHANSGGQVAIEFGAQMSEPEWSEDLMMTIQAKNPRAISYGGVRRITPREAERLQGFPDDFTAVPFRGKPAADGPRYKAIGNSMAVPVVRWIGERIEMVEAMA